MSYGKNVYGEVIYGQHTVDAEQIEKDSDIDLVRYLPQYHRGENVTRLLGVVDDELATLEFFSIDLGEQASVETATFGLEEWEEMLSIPKNPTAGFEERKEIIRSKLRGYGTVTNAMIKNTAEAFSGGEVDIVEHFGEFRFTVKFVGTKGIPRNLQNFMDMLDKIKPAHLTYDFSYTFTVWDFIKGTWNDISGTTWNDLRTYEE